MDIDQKQFNFRMDYPGFTEFSEYIYLNIIFYKK